MAIYHFHVKTQSRARGQSAVAKAAYNAGEALSAPGVVADYRKKGGVVWAAIIGADKPREEFWASVESAERRYDACLSREIEIALPVELSRTERIALCEAFGAAIRERYGLAGIDAAMHEPPRWNRRKKAKREHENPHLHLLMPDRDAGGRKVTVTVEDQEGRPHLVRAFDRKQGPLEIRAIRRLWADMCNAALKEAGHQVIVTDASIAEIEATLESREAIILDKLAALEERRKEVADANVRRAGSGSRTVERAACEDTESKEERKEASSPTSRPASRTCSKAAKRRIGEIFGGASNHIFDAEDAKLLEKRREQEFFEQRNREKSISRSIQGNTQDRINRRTVREDVVDTKNDNREDTGTNSVEEYKPLSPK